MTRLPISPKGAGASHRRNFILTDEQFAVALLMGNGNASQVIREFLQNHLDRMGCVSVEQRKGVMLFLDANGKEIARLEK